MALAPSAPPNTPVTLPQLPATSGKLQEPVQKACTLSASHPEPIQPGGTPTCRPSLSHVISGAGKPLASHSSVRDCPAMPDTLALRPSSRRLGGTWEKEKQRSRPLAGQPRPGTPFGPFFLAWRAAPTPLSSPASGLPGRPFQTLAVRSHVDLGMATAASPWDLALVEPRNATRSDIQLSKMREPLVPSGSPPKRLSWAPRRVPRGPRRTPPHPWSQSLSRWGLGMSLKQTSQTSHYRASGRGWLRGGGRWFH